MFSILPPAGDSSIAERSPGSVSGVAAAAAIAANGSSFLSSNFGTDAETAGTIRTFSEKQFDPAAYARSFYQMHEEGEPASEHCSSLLATREAARRGLREAMLVQYKSFVEGSSVMRAMGEDIRRIRKDICRQKDAVDTMMSLTFPVPEAPHPSTEDAEEEPTTDDDVTAVDGILLDPSVIGNDSLSARGGASFTSPNDSSQYGGSRGSQRNRKISAAEAARAALDERLVEAASSGPSRRFSKKNSDDSSTFDDRPPPIHPTLEIPLWVKEAVEELSALITECRYVDAVDLLLKTRAEILDLVMSRSTTASASQATLRLPTAMDSDMSAITSQVPTLTREQAVVVRDILRGVDAQADIMVGRIVERLQRTNKALRDVAVRRRKDRGIVSQPIPKGTLIGSPTVGGGLGAAATGAAASATTPVAAPVASLPLNVVCLNDDAVPLSLLVRLGRSTEAAHAYAQRRSLLLEECMAVEPLSDNPTDLVVCAAQLSRSFFTSLAEAIEGFLDIFLTPTEPKNGNEFKDCDEESTISSAAMCAKNVPSAALSSVVLWSDGELKKFAAVFGGSQILCKLKLRRDMSPRKTSLGFFSENVRDQGKGFSLETRLAEQKTILETAEKEGRPSVAAAARTKIAQLESQQELENNKLATEHAFENKVVDTQRKETLDIATQCVLEALQMASLRLDNIGLPLTPRLTDFLRPYLKGCEGEVARLLGEDWDYLVGDWYGD